MNQANTEIEKIGIIVIQSLEEESDRLTGTELEQDVLQYKPYKHKNSFVRLHNAKNKDNFISILKCIEDDMKEGEIFTLHFETHGNMDGIDLASGERITWAEFYDCIRPINIKMAGLLLVVMSMCVGAATLTHIEPNERAPYRAFIGSYRNMTEDELARGFAAFYGEYTNILDIEKGMMALKNELISEKEPNGPFWIFTCEAIFDATFDADRDPKAFAKVVDQAYQTQKMRGIDCTRQSIEEEIKNLFEEMKKYKPYFCFEDLYVQENKNKI